MNRVFRHEVLLYAGAEEFLEGALPFLEGALEAGEPSAVAVGEKKAANLRGALGDDAGQVHFIDMEELGRNPARIIPFWRAFLDGHGGAGQPMRAIGEPIWPGRGGAEVDECQRHESLLNVAFGGVSGWRLLCPYDSRSLDDEILDAARGCHPFLAGGEDSDVNPDWTDGCDATDPFAGELEPRPAGVEKLAFDRGALHEVRSLVGREAERWRLGAARCSDLVTAASELAANSVLHGGGRGTLSIWKEKGELLVEVEDSGWIEDPLAGRRRPDSTQVSGRGLWLVNSLCDLVQIRSGPAGTAVRLRMAT